MARKPPNGPPCVDLKTWSSTVGKLLLIAEMVEDNEMIEDNVSIGGKDPWVSRCSSVVSVFSRHSLANIAIETTAGSKKRNKKTA